MTTKQIKKLQKTLILSHFSIGFLHSFSREQSWPQHIRKEKLWKEFNLQT
jgi:hypothetical protein